MIEPLGDHAVLIGLGDEIQESVHGRVKAVCDMLDRSSIPGVVEWVPAFTSVAVVYDPLVTACSVLIDHLRRVLADLPSLDVLGGRIVDIPVCYGGPFGPDLHEVARRCGLSEAEVIRLHSEPLYRVYMVGFVPGFPYLGGLPKRLAAPRKRQPRTQVPEGSVGIAGEQTGIYSLSTPGGWQIIGRTPVKLFDPTVNPPSYLQMGDRVRFCPISEETYHNLYEAAHDEAARGRPM
ncbi:5-oxoprolinase subunit PxpB [Alicyclobacillus cycloheptanicus]|nr:5-oxoprolinase subunit PxpB [Alicyclobacillus cycloheptanicus]